MKKAKRLFSLILAMALVFAMAIPTYADTETYTLTINHEHEGHQYEAYQIFSGTLLDGDADSDPNTVGLILSNIKWGASIPEEKRVALINALKADTAPLEYLKDGATVTTTLATVFSALDATAANSADSVANILGASQPTVVVNRFAEVVGRFNQTENAHDYLGTAIAVSEYISSDGSVKAHYKITGLPAGYYLVKDTEKSQDGKDSFYTQYILQVVHSTSVNVKGEAIKLEKGINDTLDGTYTDHEDFDINDTVYYKLDGELPENIYAYETYMYKFVDTLPVGINVIDIEKIYIEDGNGEEIVVIYENNKDPDIETPGDVGGVTYTLTENEIDKKDAEENLIYDPNGNVVKVPQHSFILEFADLKQYHEGLMATDHIIVKYSARITRDAVTNEAITNKAHIEYDNNPDGEGYGKSGDVEAHAYTYKLSIYKHELNKYNNPLEGVEFKLYYKDSKTGTNHYALVVTEEMVTEKVIINGKIVNEAMVGTVYGWTTDKEEAAILDTDANGMINLYGLDVDTYYLEETKTAGGYNLLEGAVTIGIVPDYKDVEKVAVTYYVNGESQGEESKVSIANARGNALPSTGGMGTTLFYAGGGILVLLAVVLLITKKRMQTEE